MYILFILNVSFNVVSVIWQSLKNAFIFNNYTFFINNYLKKSNLKILPQNILTKWIYIRLDRVSHWDYDSRLRWHKYTSFFVLIYQDKDYLVLLYMYSANSRILYGTSFRQSILMLVRVSLTQYSIYSTKINSCYLEDL